MRNFGMSQREKLHLNLLRQADYKDLVYRESSRPIWWAAICAIVWAFLLSAFLSGCAMQGPTKVMMIYDLVRPAINHTVPG